MYSAAISSPRDGVARPSRASDARKETSALRSLARTCAAMRSASGGWICAASRPAAARAAIGRFRERTIPMIPPGTDKTATDFRRFLPEFRWQSCPLGWAWGPREFMKKGGAGAFACQLRSEEHTSELQSLRHLVCRLLLEKKKTKN